MSEMKGCSARVFDAWRSYPCARAGVLKEEGQWWCKQHAPSTKAARSQKWEEKFKRESKERSLRFDVELAAMDIVKAADLWEQNLVGAPHELKSAVQKWRKLNQKLEKLKATTP